MLFHCTNQDCNTDFIIPNRDLDPNQPSAECPSCKTISRVEPMVGHCSQPNCGKKFRYYDFQFTDHKPVVACPHCNALNPVAIRFVAMINTEGEFKELLKTRQARCGNQECRKIMQYQEIMLDLVNPLVTCPHCKSINRIKIKSLNYSGL